MGSVSSTGSTLSDLLQTLSTASPELSSLLSTPQAQAGLASAPPGDLVELSDQALQLQQVGLLFGNSNGTQSSPDSLFSALVANSAPESDPALQAVTATLADQNASTASNAQAQQLEALFGATSTVDPLLNTQA